MKAESLKDFERKEVKIILNNRYNYNGLVKRIDGDTLVLLDKFGLLVSINIAEISIITEKQKEVVRDFKPEEKKNEK